MVSVNQVRHMFVVDGLVETTPTAKGKVKVCTTKDGDATYLQYMGKGGLLASDLIKKDQVIYAKKTTAEQGQLKMKEATLTLKKDSLVAGEDYIVDIVVSNYIALGEESTLVKFGAVHATSSMKESDFYVDLARSFARNFSREVNKFFKFYLESASSREEVTVTSKHSGTYTGVTIVELPQTADYVVGEVAVKPVYFNVVPHTIISDGDEIIPFENVTPEGVIKLTDSATLYVGNGYELADTEYFCMGERGDIYRQMGYPRTIRTEYMIVPEQEYDVIDIAFYFVGRGVDAQKSEKHLTLVGTPSAIQAIAAALDKTLGTELAETEE